MLDTFTYDEAKTTWIGFAPFPLDAVFRYPEVKRWARDVEFTANAALHPVVFFGEPEYLTLWRHTALRRVAYRTALRRVKPDSVESDNR